MRGDDRRGGRVIAGDQRGACIVAHRADHVPPPGQVGPEERAHAGRPGGVCTSSALRTWIRARALRAGRAAARREGPSICARRGRAGGRPGARRPRRCRPSHWTGESGLPDRRRRSGTRGGRRGRRIPPLRGGARPCGGPCAPVSRRSRASRTPPEPAVLRSRPWRRPERCRTRRRTHRRRCRSRARRAPRTPHAGAGAGQRASRRKTRCQVDGRGPSSPRCR